MARITDISVQKKNTDRVNVFIDGQFAFGISAAVCFEERLGVGEEFSGQRIRELIEKDQIERLVNKALRFLSFRPRSEKELRGLLLRKGKLTEIKSEEEKAQYEISIEKTISKLKKIGQIDDASFASWWLEQRLRFKPTATYLIKRELLAKGLAKELVEQTLEGISREQEIELAKSAASKKLKSYRNLVPEKAKERLGVFLARRGFSWETIKEVVDTLLVKGIK
jgi:regulatory protein